VGEGVASHSPVRNDVIGPGILPGPIEFFVVAGVASIAASGAKLSDANASGSIVPG